LPEIPESSGGGGFDLGSLLGGLGGMLGGGNKNKPRTRARRRPTYTE